MSGLNPIASTYSPVSPHPAVYGGVPPAPPADGVAHAIHLFAFPMPDGQQLYASGCTYVEACLSIGKTLCHDGRHDQALSIYLAAIEMLRPESAALAEAATSAAPTATAAAVAAAAAALVTASDCPAFGADPSAKGTIMEAAQTDHSMHGAAAAACAAAASATALLDTGVFFDASLLTVEATAGTSTPASAGTITSASATPAPQAAEAPTAAAALGGVCQSSVSAAALGSLYEATGDLYMACGMHADAATAYRHAVGAFPRDGGKWLRLGCCLYSLHEAAAAAACGAEGGVEGGAVTGAVAGAVAGGVATGAIADAVQAFRLAVRLDPSSESSYLSLGQALRRQGASLEALLSFHR